MQDLRLSQQHANSKPKHTVPVQVFHNFMHFSHSPSQIPNFNKIRCTKEVSHHVYFSYGGGIPITLVIWQTVLVNTCYVLTQTILFYTVFYYLNVIVLYYITYYSLFYYYVIYVYVYIVLLIPVTCFVSSSPCWYYQMYQMYLCKYKCKCKYISWILHFPRVYTISEGPHKDVNSVLCCTC